ncbi:MAG: cupin domain-containing protein [Eubacteriales bacterium]|nr:cupin domain-containing protein [Eubacteriales bacterium]
MFKEFKYTLTDSETFENVFKEENLLMNHVLIPPGKFFEKHPTDANVHVIILRGALTVAVDDGERVSYEKGSVLNISKGSPSELGNAGNEPTELMVIKSDL